MVDYFVLARRTKTQVSISDEIQNTDGKRGGKRQDNHKNEMM